MKKVITAFFSYSRTERLGIAIMGFLLMLLMIVRCTLSLWVHPAATSKEEQEKMRLAYTVWKLRESRMQPQAGTETAAVSSQAGEPFIFDPNTLDSSGFIRLGLPARAVKGLLSWRRSGKHFYSAEDLKPLYNLPAETYVRLQPYIRIADLSPRARDPGGQGHDYPAIPSIIDLNTADSALLDRGVRGIGATLAHKIIARRTALGGFTRHEQLLEVYRFSDTTFQQLKEKLSIDASRIQKMNLNTVTLARMSTHPYIGERTAKNILLYKEGIGRYSNVEQLQEVPLMSGENYRKIAPYFVVD